MAPKVRLRWLPIFCIGDKNEMAVPEELLDQVVLLDLEKQIGRVNLHKVFTTVITEVAQRWEELLLAESSGDKSAMQRHVHSLSSIFRSVGLMPAGEACLSVELQLRAGVEIDAARIQGLEGVISRSLNVLDQQLSSK